MLTRDSNEGDFVVCVANTGYEASLELRKVYQVVHDDEAAADGDLRVIDESGEDYIYPSSFFAPVSVPSNVRESFIKQG